METDTDTHAHECRVEGADLGVAGTIGGERVCDGAAGGNRGQRRSCRAARATPRKRRVGKPGRGSGSGGGDGGGGDVGRGQRGEGGGGGAGVHVLGRGGRLHAAVRAKARVGPCAGERAGPGSLRHRAEATAVHLRRGSGGATAAHAAPRGTALACRLRGGHRGGVPAGGEDVAGATSGSPGGGARAARGDGEGGGRPSVDADGRPGAVASGGGPGRRASEGSGDAAAARHCPEARP